MKNRRLIFAYILSAILSGLAGLASNAVANLLAPSIAAQPWLPYAALVTTFVLSLWPSTYIFSQGLSDNSVGRQQMRELSDRMRNRINDLRLRSKIHRDLEHILRHNDYPALMSISGELVTNPIWQNVRVDVRGKLVAAFRPDADTCPRVMLLDIFLIRADDSNRNPRLLTYFSGKPHSGWQAFLFPFRHRPADENIGERHIKNAKDIALFLGLASESVTVSSLGEQYVISIKPDPGYSDLVIYIFEFCSVQLLEPPSWLSKTDCRYSLEYGARRFHWFHPEDLERERRTMLVNGDLVRAIHSQFSTTIPLVPESVPWGFVED